MLRWVSMRAFPGLIASFAAAATLSPAQVVTGSLPSPDVYHGDHGYTCADHVHCYGDDRIRLPRSILSPDGIRFAQAFTPSPITNTSHTTY